MLQLEQISKHFGGLHVLENVSLLIPPTGIFGLIGPNGAGKTTLFNLITGLLPCSTGIIQFDGHHLNQMAPHQITRLGIARTFQNIRLFKEMSVLENVVVGMHTQLDYPFTSMLLRLPRARRLETQAQERARELLSWMGLEQKAAYRADALSYGEQRKLEFARALATKPKLLLLDEPVAGMNPAEKAELMTEIQQISQRGFCILMIEHDMRFVMQLCERIAVLNFGRIIAEGSPEQIRQHPQVIDAYLGEETPTW